MDYELTFDCIMHGIDSINNRYQHIANKYNLSFNSIKIIELLFKKELTQTNICTELKLAKSTIHSAILLLEKEGIIEYVDINNKEKNIILTKKGLSLAKDINKDILEMKKDIIERINKDDLNHIINAFFKL